MATVLSPVSSIHPDNSGNAYSHPYELLEYNPGLTPDQSRTRTRYWCNAAFDEAQIWMKNSREVTDFPKQVAFLLGQQWSQKRPSYKSSPINNRLLRSMEETIAVLTDIRQAYRVGSGNDAFSTHAELLTKTTKSWWINQDVDFSLAMALVYAYLSTGYLKIVWNDRLSYGMGDFQAVPLGIDEVMPIGPAHNLQDWEGVIHNSVRPLTWFRRRFPKDAWRIKPSISMMSYLKPQNRPSFVGQGAWDMMSPGMRRQVGSPQESGMSVTAVAPYREFWVRDYSINTSSNIVQMADPRVNWSYKVQPGGMLYPRGRLIITGGEDFQTVYDGPNWHWHARWPFIAIRLKPMPFQFHGISELLTKLPMQEVVNHILAGILDMVKKAINPSLMFPDGSFSDAVVRAMDPSMPNAKIGYNPTSGLIPQWSNPPNLPSFVYQSLFYIQNEMDDDSGLIDMAGMARKKVTPAGDTLEQLKESQQTIMRLRGRYIEVAVRELGEQMVPNFIQMYGLKRRMFMFGAAGVTFQDVFDYEPGRMWPAGYATEEYIRHFFFSVYPDTLLRVNRTQDVLLDMALRARGDMSRKSLFDSLDKGAIYDKVQSELDAEQAKAMQQQLAIGIASGKVQAPPLQLPAAGEPNGGKGSRNDQNLLSQGG